MWRCLDVVLLLCILLLVDCAQVHQGKKHQSKTGRPPSISTLVNIMNNTHWSTESTKLLNTKVLGDLSDDDKLYQGFKRDSLLPRNTNEARKQGWKMVGDECIEGLGYQYQKPDDGFLGTGFFKKQVSKKHPSIIYFTPAGQIAGVGVHIRMWGGIFSSSDEMGDQIITSEENGRSPRCIGLKKHYSHCFQYTNSTSCMKYSKCQWLTKPRPGFFVRTKDNKKTLRISASFRHRPCQLDEYDSKYPFGNQLVINQDIHYGFKYSKYPNGMGFNIPIRSNRLDSSWKQGSCFDDMGTHWYKDLDDTDEIESWQTRHLIPVWPMYHNNFLHSFFFLSQTVQQSIPFVRPNDWEPIQLVGKIFCGNTCDSRCNMGGVVSTMHIFLNDPALVKCERDAYKNCLGFGCCPDGPVLSGSYMKKMYQPRNSVSGFKMLASARLTGNTGEGGAAFGR